MYCGDVGEEILHNYFLRIHIQPEDGYYQEPKHVVVPYAVNTIYTSTIK